jgi:hypothetical protein
MHSLVSDACLFTTLAFFCLHVVLVAILKPPVAAVYALSSTAAFTLPPLLDAA